MLISFEGIDGSGKSTQIAKLADWLRAKDYDVLTTREPGGTATGEAVRALLLNPESHISARAEFLLYSASRAQLVDDVIRPHLKRTRAVVIADRYADSSTAYQGAGRELGLEEVEKVNVFATGNLAPDLTLYLDVDYSTSEARRNSAGSKPDRLERNPREFFERVREGYLALAKRHPERVRVIDARQNEEQVFERICAEVAPLLAGK
ncbi:dTMP kinase [bacterium]|nr:dTMP kinase [bacterium]